MLVDEAFNIPSLVPCHALQFKDDANDKAHSWYHIVKSRKELDDTNFQDIIEMIVRLEKSISMIDDTK